MRGQLDDFVITDTNADAANVIVDICKDREQPKNIFLYGEPGAGKTTILQARALDKDLLATKHAMYTAAPELLLAFDHEDVMGKYLDKVPEVEVLFFDDFDHLFTEGEYGVMAGKLLIAERKRNGVETVIVGTKPLSEYDLSGFEGVLDDFEELELKKLQPQDYPAYIKNRIEKYTDDENEHPTISDEAIDYIADHFAGDLKNTELFIRFLETATELGTNDVIDVATVQEALSTDA